MQSVTNTSFRRQIYSSGLCLPAMHLQIKSVLHQGVIHTGTANHNKGGLSMADLIC